MLMYSEGATQAQEDEAKLILEALDAAYPGHPWGVRVYEGGFFIRHLDFPSNYGMNCKYKSFGYSASEMKRQIIFMAGEWLERANLIRGKAREGEEIGRVEGVPEKYQPASAKPPVEEVVILGADGQPAKRPEVLNAALH